MAGATTSTTGFAVRLGLLACVPDLDLLVPHSHRTASHSFLAVVVVGCIAALAGRRRGRPSCLPLAGVVAAAYATHLLLDWLGEDMGPPAGIQVLWPVSDRWFVSGLNVFAGIDRQDPLAWKAVRENGMALVREVLLLGPVLALAAWVGSRRSRAFAKRTG